jgi:hypothetical protein
MVCLLACTVPCFMSRSTHLVHAVLHVHHALGVRVPLEKQRMQTLVFVCEEKQCTSRYTSSFTSHMRGCSPRWRGAAARRESSSRRWGTWSYPGRCRWTGKTPAYARLRRKKREERYSWQRECMRKLGELHRPDDTACVESPVMALRCCAPPRAGGETLTSLVALLEYVVVHHDVVPPKLHLVLQVRKQPSHLRGEVDDVRGLVLLKDGRRLHGVGQVSILHSGGDARAKRGERVRRVLTCRTTMP